GDFVHAFADCFSGALADVGGGAGNGLDGGGGDGFEHAPRQISRGDAGIVFAQVGKVNVRQRQGHFLAAHAGETDVDFGAGDPKVVHFNLLAGFVARPDSGIRGPGSAAFGDGVDVLHDFAEVVSAERIAFKGDFRRFNAHRAHNDFVR